MKQGINLSLFANRISQANSQLYRCTYYKNVHEVIMYHFIFPKNPLKRWRNNKRTFTCHNKVVWVWNRKFSECTCIQCYEQKKMIISWMQFGQQEIIWSFGTLLVPLPNLLLQHNGDKSFLKKHLHFFSYIFLRFLKIFHSGFK